MTNNTLQSGSQLLAPSQLRTFDELLAIGRPRPVAPAGLIDELRDTLLVGTADAIEATGESSMWMGKAIVANAHRCEGLVAAERENRTPGRMLDPVAVGIVTHRAIQLAHTDPGRTVAEYVRDAISGSRRRDEGFATWFEHSDAMGRSDLSADAEARTAAFLDAWPPLVDTWTPRFESSLQARIGRLILGARPDLVLGRPRADGTQTMLVVDVKSGGLGEHHDLEADFYALVAALRYGVPPWRSCVFSLASGEWTNPDVDAVRLRNAVDAVVKAVVSTAEVLSGSRDAELTAGAWCRFCPVRETCPAALAAEAAETSE